MKATRSSLNDDESFPRRGAAVSASTSTQSPSTLRQKRPPNRDGEVRVGGSAEALERKRRRVKSTDDEPIQDEEEKQLVWTRMLTNKLCVKDLLVLACVRAVSRTAVQLELSDGVLGMLSPENVSRCYSALLEVTETRVIGLPEMFHCGQLLSCRVVESTSNDASSSRQLPSVTTEPSLVNRSVVAAALTHNYQLMAAVESEQDKGYVLDLGLSAIKGFLPKTDVEHCHRDIHLGQTFLCRIVDRRGNTKIKRRRIAQVSIQLVEYTENDDFAGSTLTKADLMPGLRLPITSVSAALNSGVVVHLSNSDVKGFISCRRLPPKFRQNFEKLSRTVVDSPIPSTVTFVLPNTHMLGLSTLEEVVDTGADQRRTTFQGVSVGDIVQCTVDSVSDRGAVYFGVSLGDGGRKLSELIGVAGRMNLEEDGCYEVGSRHRCRVVGYRLMDRILVLSAKKATLNQQFVTVADVRPGMRVDGVVESVKPGGVYVRVYDTVKAFVSPLHAADNPHIKQLHRFIKPGQSISCRVLYVEQAKSRIILTAKSDLVDSKLPIIDAFASAKVGLRTSGLVVLVKSSGALIELFGNLVGWIKWEDLAAASLTVGSVINVHVIGTDEKKGRIFLAPSSVAGVATKLQATDCPALSAAKVVEVVANVGLKLCLIPTNFPAFVSTANLTDCLDSVPFVDSLFEHGQKLTVARLGPNVHSAKGHVMTAKPMAIKWVESGPAQGRPLSKFEQLESGRLVVGVVSNAHPQLGYFVNLAGSPLTGLAPLVLVDSTMEEKPLSVGQTVLAKVSHIDVERTRFTLSLKLKECYPAEISPIDFIMQLPKQLLGWLDRGLSAALKRNIVVPSIGDVVDVEFKDWTADGLFMLCNLLSFSSFTGFVAPEHMQKMNYQLGSPVKAVVIHVECLPNFRVELSFWHELLSPCSKTSGKLKSFQPRVKAKFVLRKGDFALAYTAVSSSYLFLPTRLHPNATESSFDRLSVGEELTVRMLDTDSGTGRQFAISEADEEKLNQMEIEFSGLTSSKTKSIKNPKQTAKVVRGEIVDAIVVGPYKEAGLLNSLSVQLSISGLKGRLHVSELAETDRKALETIVKNRLEAAVGGTETDNHRRRKQTIMDLFLEKYRNLTIKVKVIQTSKGKLSMFEKKENRRTKRTRRTLIKVLECSMNPEKMALTTKKKSVVGYKFRFHDNDVVTFYPLKFGLDIQGEVNPLWKAVVKRIYCSSDSDVVFHPQEHFSVGQPCQAKVLSVDSNKKLLELSLLPQKFKLRVKPMTCVAARVLSLVETLSETDELGRVIRLVLANGHSGSVSLCNLNDDFDLAQSTLAKLNKWSTILVCPLDWDADSSQPEWKMSIRESQLGKSTANRPRDPFVAGGNTAFRVGRLLRAFVVAHKTEGKLPGLRIALSASVFGFVHARKLEADWPEVGQIVRVRVEEMPLHRGTVPLIPLDLLTNETRTERRFRTDYTDRKKSEPVQAVKKEDASIVADAGHVEVLSTGDGNDADTAFTWQPDRFAPSKFMQIGLDDDADTKVTVAELDENNGEAKKCHGGAKEPINSDDAYEQELKLVQGIGPETEQNFQRLVVGSPDSSQQWLRYMAFFLHNGDVKQARATAERALKTISFRKEDEKLNIWTGYMNLENHWGNEITLRDVFERAIQMCEPFKLYKQLVKMFQNSGKLKECDNLFDEMLKKFRQTEPEVWYMAGQHYMDSGRPEKARDAMHAAIKSLPKQHHVDATSRFAQLEFKSANGDPERGKTLFESILSSYPRRMDVWLVYIDMLTKYCLAEEVRPIFERASSLSLNRHKMRALFKKWLQFEEKYGDDQSAERIKQRAASYLTEQNEIEPVVR